MKKRARYTIAAAVVTFAGTAALGAQQFSSAEVQFRRFWQ